MNELRIVQFESEFTCGGRHRWRYPGAIGQRPLVVNEVGGFIRLARRLAERNSVHLVKKMRDFQLAGILEVERSTVLEDDVLHALLLEYSLTDEAMVLLPESGKPFREMQRKFAARRQRYNNYY